MVSISMCGFCILCFNEEGLFYFKIIKVFLYFCDISIVFLCLGSVIIFFYDMIKTVLFSLLPKYLSTFCKPFIGYFIISPLS